jgi:hypothetical protein
MTVHGSPNKGMALYDLTRLFFEIASDIMDVVEESGTVM